jgi:hypothetical protein
MVTSLPWFCVALILSLASSAWAEQRPTRDDARSFMRLNFTGFAASDGVVAEKPDLIYRQNVRLAVQGGNNYRGLVDQALADFGTAFDIEVVDPDDAPDILLDIWTVPGGERRDFQIEQANRLNRVSWERSGYSHRVTPDMQLFDRVAGRVAPVSEDMTAPGPAAPGTVAPCIVVAIYESLEEAENTLGRTADGTFRMPELFYASVATVKGSKPIPEGLSDATLAACIYEELGHALTGWNDIRRSGFLTMFSSGGEPSDLNSSMGEMDTIWPQDRDKLLRVLSLYRAAGLEPGMSREEVKARVFAATK